MMDNFDFNGGLSGMMGSNSWMGTFGSITIILLDVTLVLLIVWLWRQLQKGGKS